ncbi:hypothetical protein KM043_010613 [Ampulex compressa]|nr:hypothetical protein KM043_010613 [Ampulex compressa]
MAHPVHRSPRYVSQLWDATQPPDELTSQKLTRGASRRRHRGGRLADLFTTKFIKETRQSALPLPNSSAPPWPRPFTTATSIMREIVSGCRLLEQRNRNLLAVLRVCRLSCPKLVLVNGLCAVYQTFRGAYPETTILTIVRC